jgi:hypothetical protein
MHRARRVLSLAGVTVVAVAALAFGLVPAAPSGAHDATDVVVINAASQPVPVDVLGTTRVNGAVRVNNPATEPVPVALQGTAAVTGTVSVSNSVTNPVPVHAAQSGAWTVSVSGEPTVRLSTVDNLVRLDAATSTINVANSASAPLFVRVAEPALEPFQQQLMITIPNQETAGSASFTVPTGKRLVVEAVSGYALLPGGMAFRYAALQTSVGGVAANHFLQTRLDPDTRANHIALPVPTRLYADPGTAVTAQVQRHGVAGATSDITVSVSGYLLNAP